jgi:tetratricopeptide (TPR) repeat protein
MTNHPTSPSTAYPSRRNWYLTILIVGSLILAVGGVLRALFYPPVHARWLVALAANELAAERVDSAVSWLDKAYDTSADIAGDRDYWRLRFEILSGQKTIPPEELERFVDQAIESINRDAAQNYKIEVAAVLSRLLFNEKHFTQAVKVLEKVFPPFEQRTPLQNNEIAYTRSIAKQGLDQALKEINRALEDRNLSGYSQLFDTKAWILHKMGDHEKALKFADAAVKEWYKELSKQNPKVAALLLPDDKFSLKKKAPTTEEKPTESDEDPEDLTRTEPETSSFRWLDILSFFTARDSSDEASVEAEETKPVAPKLLGQKNIGQERGSTLHTTAVLRYHRACILDELGKTEEALKDYYWLDLYGFKETEDLY